MDDDSFQRELAKYEVVRPRDYNPRANDLPAMTTSTAPPGPDNRGAASVRLPATSASSRPFWDMVRDVFEDDAGVAKFRRNYEQALQQLSLDDIEAMAAQLTL
ncbi:hypothetical protein PBRA_007398 [Plasmodiophora brassicae]|uniref:Uncharacterized protein n=1 Tax=Plasmodiophora brassicae TaxID=37360 RepID=A0A0G4IWJ6_PLABS|nr:hypothetical protein PBRA_007398 [Plasmodiophora brassicae]